MARPIIAITMGDPAGIGPELCLHMLSDADVSAICTPVIVGSSRILSRVAESTGLAFSVPAIGPRESEAAPPDGPAVIDLGSPADEETAPGRVCASCGRAAYEYIEWGINAALQGTVAAVVTGPINKESLNRAGLKYAGHTEIFAEKTGTGRYCMMQTSEPLTVSFVTTHMALSEVGRTITPERVADVIALTAEALTRIRGREPRIGVCGLNPHSGEHGLFGNEEAERIIPGIETARKQGLDVDGPLAPDVAFIPGVRQRYDALVCQYHDQGHIPFKMLAFDAGVNVTLGLPIIRTSVDHGTAFDIAWQGVARPTSMKQAIRLAVALHRGQTPLNGG